MSIVSSEKSELYNYFPLPCVTVHTTGMQLGIILKFRTFYLKIYDADNVQNSYIVEGWRYRDPRRVFEDVVSVNRIREYALQFNREDYLAWKETSKPLFS